MRSKVAQQANYLRTLPLHHTQQETERNIEYSIFEYFLIPTYELRQEIMTHGPDIEVLAPDSLRKDIKDLVCKMEKVYK